MSQYYGGSFAPPLTPGKLTSYAQVIAACPDPQVRDACGKLLEMVKVFQKTPASAQAGKPHPSGRGVMVPLDDAEVKRIWDHVPWDYEIEAYQKLFDRLPVNAAVRTPAFHLLWYAIELEKDREPMTSDRL